MLHWDSKKSLIQEDYDIDWSLRLAPGEFITGSSWTVTGTSLVIVTNSFTPTRTKAVLAGGVDGRDYIATNRITTNLTPNNILYEDVAISIKDK